MEERFKIHLLVISLYYLDYANALKNVALDYRIVVVKNACAHTTPQPDPLFIGGKVAVIF